MTASSTAYSLEIGDRSDCCPWPLNITVTLSPEMLSHIEQAKALLEIHPHMTSIRIRADGVLDGDIEAEMQNECRFDVERIEVFSHGWYYNIQAKHNSNTQAEYMIVETAGAA